MEILTGENNEILRKISTKIDKVDKTIKKLISGMKETLEESQGIGLAAPQVGVNKDVVLVKIDQKKPLIMINPEVIEASIEEEIGEEGCLSLPGIWGNVVRPKEVKIEFLDEKERSHKVIFKSLNARIILHEMDHLDGVLFTDRVIDKNLIKNVIE